MKIRTRLILSFMVITMFGFYHLTNWILKEMRPHYVESAEETLVDESYLLASTLRLYFQTPATLKSNLSQIFSHVAEQKFDAQIFKLTKTHFDQRIYVTDDKGIVVFDSTGLDEGVDYSSWKNISLTLRGQYGARSSREVRFGGEASVLHVTAPIEINDKLVGTVTVAKPTTNINAFIESAKPQFVVAGVVATVGVLFLGIIVSTWITWPLRRLRQYAQDVAEAKDVTLPDVGTSELKDLGYAFEDMKKSLEGKKYIEQHMQTLTHELKSPLAAILATAELLNENLPKEDAMRFSQNIGKEAKRMQDLIERLLQLATLENQIDLPNPEQLDLVRLCVETLASFDSLFEQKAIVVRTHFEDKVFVKGDAVLLRQVFVNLLHNAFEFSPMNSVIEVVIKKNGSQAEILISNDGPSIPDYALPRLFEKFYSLPRPLTGKKSSGLGLVFVRQILKLHNASIAIENGTHQGVIVRCLLPLR